VTVLRDGAVVLAAADRPTLTIDASSAPCSAIGSPPRRRPPSATISTRPAAEGQLGDALVVDGVSVPGVLVDVSLTARVGEIVGLTGVVGAGHQALLEVLSGTRPVAAGSLRLPGAARAGAPPRGLRRSVRRGVAVVSGDHKAGLMLDKPIWQNAVRSRRTRERR
jgi:ABC-type sugar transport system ATPase subunit